tara:strand:- start:272 stop:427 length:156 start_codon:yes stop_codon:yes gene_type:complete
MKSNRYWDKQSGVFKVNETMWIVRADDGRYKRTISKHKTREEAELKFCQYA